MADRQVSSVLVDADPPGIVTDRDFRRRVLAAGKGPATPVLEVFSSPLKTVSAECPIYEAWRILLDAGCHHLPVTQGGGSSACSPRPTSSSAPRPARWRS
jgi:CBS domain-containing protein